MIGNPEIKILSCPRLPARLTAEQVAGRLGFGAHDIPVLVRNKLLTPLGRPAPNAVKFFAAVSVEGLAEDLTWLGKATNAIYSYWLNQNTRRRPKSVNAASDARVMAA